MLLFAAYSHPYVISFSERAIDVFDSSSAEWLQTIPLKKVTILKQSKVVIYLTSITREVHAQSLSHQRLMTKYLTIIQIELEFRNVGF